MHGWLNPTQGKHEKGKKSFENIILLIKPPSFDQCVHPRASVTAVAIKKIYEGINKETD